MSEIDQPNAEFVGTPTPEEQAESDRENAYAEGYKRGFRDGWHDGVVEAKKTARPAATPYGTPLIQPCLNCGRLGPHTCVICSVSPDQSNDGVSDG